MKYCFRRLSSNYGYQHAKLTAEVFDWQKTITLLHPSLLAILQTH